MKLKANLPALVVVGVVVAGIAVMAGKFIGNDDQSTGAGVVLPGFSEAAQRGELAFKQNCVQCHGDNALGTDQGPPFLHKIYNPGHHGDQAFVRAVRLGVRQHHWRFGDMPAQPQVSMEQIGDIIRYVRELQEANGIKTQAHNM